MFLRSLTSVWWLFQMNLPAANLCTCIIVSVKLIWLFASNIFSLCLHLGRGCPTDCLLLCFLLSEVRNIFSATDKAMVSQSRASVENDFPAVWFGAIFTLEGFCWETHQKLEKMCRKYMFFQNVHLFLLSCFGKGLKKVAVASHLSNLISRAKIEWIWFQNAEGRFIHTF